jgi:ATP-dependent DNA ligase
LATQVAGKPFCRARRSAFAYHRVAATVEEVLEAVRKLGLEGVVGKRLGSRYEPGERSGAWIKLRSNMEQEFVVGGYIPGTPGFDALLVKVYEKRELIFVAKVKNGFVPRIRDELLPAIKALQTASHDKCGTANVSY